MTGGQEVQFQEIERTNRRSKVSIKFDYFVQEIDNLIRRSKLRSGDIKSK